MRGSPRKGRTRYDDGAFDDEETEDEREEEEVVSIDRRVPNIFLYECGCGQRFIINDKKTNLLSTHRKKCNKVVKYPYHRDDDYSDIVHMYRTKITKELVEGFRVLRGTLNRIVDWLENDGITKEEILQYLIQNTNIDEKIILANLQDFYGR